MKRVIVEMVTEEYGVYVERAVTGFIQKLSLDVEKLGSLIAAEEYKQNMQRSSGCVSNRQRQLFEKQFPTIKFSMAASKNNQQDISWKFTVLKETINHQK